MLYMLHIYILYMLHIYTICENMHQCVPSLDVSFVSYIYLCMCNIYILHMLQTYIHILYMHICINVYHRYMHHTNMCVCVTYIYYICYKHIYTHIVYEYIHQYIPSPDVWYVSLHKNYRLP